MTLPTDSERSYAGQIDVCAAAGGGVDRGSGVIPLAGGAEDAGSLAIPDRIEQRRAGGAVSSARRFQGSRNCRWCQGKYCRVAGPAPASAPTNRVERLAQLRDQFHTLAAGDWGGAIN